MIIVKDKIQLENLRQLVSTRFSDFVKTVVDIEKGIMAVDAELHADEEAALLESGSYQENLWGINIYPDAEGNDFIEFDSLINIRPRQNNRSRYVEDEETRDRIIAVVQNLLE